MKSKRHLILFSALLLLVVAALVLRRIELEDATARLTAFPRSGPGFSSKQLALTEAEQDMLGGASAVKSVYAWQGRRYAVTMVDGTRDRQAVHDPRYCFRGSGWRIESEETIDFSGGTARRMTMTRDDSETEALFFYSDGESVFDAPFDYWLRATKRRWLRKWGGPEPVLVMVQPMDPGVELEGAIDGLLPLLPNP